MIKFLTTSKNAHLEKINALCVGKNWGFSVYRESEWLSMASQILGSETIARMRAPVFSLYISIKY
jgi:hypothetical protein